MSDERVGIKELYDVNIRLLKPLEIGNRKYDINESILSFARAEASQIQQAKRDVQARGGYHNPALINWEIDREMHFAISHGVLSPVSWALLSNSILKEPCCKSVQYFERLKTIQNWEYNYVDLKYCPNACDEKMGAQPNPFNEPLPMGRQPEFLLKPLKPSKTKWIFVYDVESGKRIHDFQIYMNRIFLQEPAREIVVDYTFCYEDKVRTIDVGHRLINGFLKLDAKMSVKDDRTGIVRTGILEIPKIKIDSSLSVTLGSSYENSTVSDFYFVGYPNEDERREDQKIAEVTFLGTELSGDYGE